ncbi:MAG: acyltransferase [Bacteroidales bacterium]|nr:acyltransferase [Bacteroidales bacterium]
MENKKQSFAYKMLRTLGFHYSEKEYGNVSVWQVITRFCGNIRRKRLERMMDWPIFEPFCPRKLRPWLLRRIGCHVGKNVFIGDYVRIDLQHAGLIYIDDCAHITSGCRLLCHQRDLTDYHTGDNAADLGYKTGEIHIGKGVMVGMETMIMPGVTIGDGAIIGARSMVLKDIPPYTLAIGTPAKVVKEFLPRDDEGYVKSS